MALTIAGIMVVGSAESSVQNKQVLGFVLGLALMTVLIFVDYAFLLKFSWLFYLASIALLLMVKFFGDEINGAKRWITVAGIRFQPTELVKVFIILALAFFFMKYQEDINTIKVIFMSIGLIGIPLFFILLEPDLSTSIVVTLIFATLIFMSGLSYKIVGGVIAVFAALVGVGLWLIFKTDISVLQGYQANRIRAWRFPEDYPDLVYQQTNSIMAIGSGQIFGKGLNNDLVDSVKNGNFLSEPQTDFIFAVIGEELGFVGGVVIIVLLFLVVIECLITAARAKDLAGRLICCGMAAWVGFQTFVNIGVATGMLPNTGVTLPFVSYGLSSLISVFIAIGIVLNVGMQPKSSR